MAADERSELSNKAQAPWQDIATAPKDGTTLIAAERQRQVTQEDWSPEHDDAHRYGELVTAAMCYAIHASHQTRGAMSSEQELVIKSRWPWERRWWKPSDDPIRNLVKAGALIAAEIDRLKRSALPPPPAAAEEK